jgi:hypothetical protein
MVGKYIEDSQSRAALAVASLCTEATPTRVPYRYDGAAWVMQAGERHDLALIRRGMGDWLTTLADIADDAAEVNQPLPIWLAGELRMQVIALRDKARDSGLLSDEASRLEAEALGLLDTARILIGAASEQQEKGSKPYILARELHELARDMHSAPSGRARHLLELASQFDGFRAPNREPADWVATLGVVPRSVHVRVTEVWQAFCAAEPALSARLGTTGGRRALYAAMDKRYGVRTKLGGYSGWRGVGMPAA